MGGNKLEKLSILTVKIGSGATPTGGKESYKEYGIPLIRSQNVYNDGFKYNGLAFIDDQQAMKLDNVVVTADDVLLNITGDSIARSCQAPEDVLPARVNQHVAIIRANADILFPKYLRFVLISPEMQGKLLSLASSGATRNALTKDMIGNLKIPLPPLPTQRAIAHILGALDDKIELLRRMNETLEAMARALFKSWFVDFDPVRKKAAGEPTGLPPEIDSLFPASFVDSELGEIPEGWGVASISECSSLLVRGITPKYSDDCGMIVLNQKCIRDHKVDFSKARFHDNSKKAVHKTLQPLDLLVNSTGQGTLGRVAQIHSLESDTTVDSHVTIIRPKSLLLAYFLGINLMQREGEIESLAEGSTGQTELSRDRLGCLSLVLPTNETLAAFNQRIISLLKNIDNNQAECISLGNIRDSLLPKLISGELEIKDIDMILEPAQ